MPDWIVIAKNESGSTVVIEELGIEILNGTQITLSDYFDYSDISDSAELAAYVLNGNLVLNNGSLDLAAADGVNYIRRDNVYRDLQTHYTKTELSVPGAGGVVDWANIVNTPSFGSPLWKEPVKYRVLDIAATAPATPAVGDVYVSTTDQNYYKWDGTAWVSDGSAVAGHRVINLADATQDVYTFDGTSTWTDGGVVADNAAVMVNDDGDGHNSQYVYSTETGEWIKIADVNFEDHLDGAAGKHDASEIDVEGTYSNFASSPGDLETILSEINTQMTTALDNNTLGSAYNQGGPGVGRIITATSGAVEIDTASATTAPLRLVPKAALPTTSLLDGQMAVKDGILCIYDATRGKWLSVQRQFLVFGRRGRTSNQYINFSAGNMPSNNSGYRLQRDATVVSLSGQLDASGTCTLHVRKNDTATNIASLAVSTAVGNADISLNVDMNVGDFLQSFCAVPTGNVQDPMFIIEIAYRI